MKGYRWRRSDALDFGHEQQLVQSSTGRVCGEVKRQHAGVEQWEAWDARQRPYIDLGQYVTAERARRAVEVAVVAIADGVGE
jgi:hypothetical protein